MFGPFETPKSSAPLTFWGVRNDKILEDSHCPCGMNTTILEVFGVLERPESQIPQGFSLPV